MIGSLGWQELLIILVILALLFGASRVADLGGALGKGIREFRSEARGDNDDPETPVPPTQTAVAAPPPANTTDAAPPAERDETPRT